MCDVEMLNTKSTLNFPTGDYKVYFII